MLLVTDPLSTPEPDRGASVRAHLNDHGNVTMVMSLQTITATRLKAELLGVLDAVQSTGSPVVVTKHGRPVARLVPVADDVPLAGSVKFLVDDEELLAPIDAEWDADR